MGSTVQQSTKPTQWTVKSISQSKSEQPTNLQKGQSRQLSNIFYYSAGQQVINQLVISQDISLIHQFINKYIVSNFVKWSVIIQYYRISRGCKQVISYIFQPLSQQQPRWCSESVSKASQLISQSVSFVSQLQVSHPSVSKWVSKSVVYLFIYHWLFWTQASPEGMCTNGTQVPCKVPSLPNPTTRKGWPHNRGLRPLLFSSCQSKSQPLFQSVIEFRKSVSWPMGTLVSRSFIQAVRQSAFQSASQLISPLASPIQVS